MCEQAFCAFHRRSGGTEKQKVHGTSAKTLGPAASRNQDEYVHIFDLTKLRISIVFV